MHVETGLNMAVLIYYPVSWYDAFILVPQVSSIHDQSGHELLCSACHRSSAALMIIALASTTSQHSNRRSNRQNWF